VPLPEPIPGLVLHFSYLWRDQHRTGLEEGTKDRPCVVVLARIQTDADTIVVVAPITHTPPRMSAAAVLIPADTKRRLGLDDAPSWIVVNELNRFHWPGADLRPIPGVKPLRFDYGMLPPSLLRQVAAGVTASVAQRRLRTTCPRPTVLSGEASESSTPAAGLGPTNSLASRPTV
jgi:PemK-like, MazF-like toxin of type II toxin-antitoxin system